MILYLDTSALVKRFFAEEYSGLVLSKWKSAQYILTSAVTYAETLACFYRKQDELDLGDEILANMHEEFLADWKSFIRIQVNDSLNPFVEQVMFRNAGLRGFDAVHLASAVMVKELISKDVVFICFDARLIAAAQRHGLQTL